MGLGLAFPVQLWGGDAPSVGLSLSGAGGSALHRAAPPPKVPSSEPHIPGAGQDRAQPLSTQLRPHPLCPLQATGARGVERGPRAHLQAV